MEIWDDTMAVSVAEPVARARMGVWPASVSLARTRPI